MYSKISRQNLINSPQKLSDRERENKTKMFCSLNFRFSEGHRCHSNDMSKTSKQKVPEKHCENIFQCELEMICCLDHILTLFVEEIFCSSLNVCCKFYNEKMTNQFYNIFQLLQNNSTTVYMCARVNRQFTWGG